MSHATEGTMRPCVVVPVKFAVVRTGVLAFDVKRRMNFLVYGVTLEGRVYGSFVHFA